MTVLNPPVEAGGVIPCGHILLHGGRGLAPSNSLTLQCQAAGPKTSQQRDWQKGGSMPPYKALKKGKKELGEHDQIVEPIKEEAVLAGEVFAVVQVVGAVPLVDGAVWLGF